MAVKQVKDPNPASPKPAIEPSANTELALPQIVRPDRAAISEAGRKLYNALTADPAAFQSQNLINEEVRGFLAANPDMAAYFIDPKTLELYGAAESRKIKEHEKFIATQRKLLADPTLSAEERQRLTGEIEKAELFVKKLSDSVEKSQLTKLSELRDILEKDADENDPENRSQPKFSSPNSGSGFSFVEQLFREGYADRKSKQHLLEQELDQLAAKERAKAAAVHAAVIAAKAMRRCGDIMPSAQAIEHAAREAAGIGPLEPDAPFSVNFQSYDLGNHNSLLSQNTTCPTSSKTNPSLAGLVLLKPKENLNS